MSQLIKTISSNILVTVPEIPGEPPTPGSAGTPSTPGSAGHPAYCVKELDYQYETVSMYCMYPGYPGSPIPPDPGAPVPPGGSHSGGNNDICVVVHTGIWNNVYKEHCYPKADPSPSKPGTAPTESKPGKAEQEQQTIVIEDRHVGWTGSAISIASFGATDNVKLTFRFRGVGAVVGFNDADEGSTYPEIDYGFYAFSAGQYYVMERGDIVILNGAAVYGVVEDHDPQFAIIRFNGQVMYYIWVTDHWQRVYTSTRRSEAPIFTDCSIYMGGDVIA